MRKSQLLLIFTVVLFGSLFAKEQAYASTYYIDFFMGSDSNNGTSKTTPWKRAPGMAGCVITCATTTPQAGDNFIFKGGVTWNHTALGMIILWSGTFSSPIYFGTDETWYVGSAWSRPVFNGDHTILARPDSLITLSNVNYVTIDNIELKGHTAYSNWGPASISLSCTTHVIMTRLYVHDWALSTNVGSDDAHGGIFANNYGTCDPVGTIIDKSVISNTEARDVGRQNGVAVRAVDVQYSVIHDVSTAQLFGRMHDSLVYNISYPANNYTFDTAYHTNVTYLQGWNGNAQEEKEPAYIYNNVFYNIDAGSGGLYANVCGTIRNATYMFNNIIYNNFAAATDIQIETYGGSAGCGVMYVWNNTLYGTSSGVGRIVNRGIKFGTLDIRNNHYITNAGTFDFGAGVNNLYTPHSKSAPRYARISK